MQRLARLNSLIIKLLLGFKLMRNLSVKPRRDFGVISESISEKWRYFQPPEREYELIRCLTMTRSITAWQKVLG